MSVTILRHTVYRSGDEAYVGVVIKTSHHTDLDATMYHFQQYTIKSDGQASLEESNIYTDEREAIMTWELWRR